MTVYNLLNDKIKTIICNKQVYKNCIFGPTQTHKTYGDFQNLKVIGAYKCSQINHKIGGKTKSSQCRYKLRIKPTTKNKV